MAETDGTTEVQDMENPEEVLDDEQAALLQFSKYIEMRRSLPWEQWTFREKINFYLDRIFLGLLIVFVIVALCEFVYKMWYVTNVKKITEFVVDSLVFVFEWLFKQDKQEELIEL
ncbi:hypothetical protein NL108_010336 [Boleophthalmus pectinirostris]|nr:hypothetical protein NL108_010336 [Boleophthalmus pectinirostris]